MIFLSTGKLGVQTDHGFMRNPITLNVLPRLCYSSPVAVIRYSTLGKTGKTDTESALSLFKMLHIVLIQKSTIKLKN